MRRCLPLALLLLAGAAYAQPRGGGGGGRYADPSGVISAEMALGRLAIEKGEEAALAKMGAKDAILFAPGPVYAQKWAKGRHGPPVSIRWQTRQVFMSCDGRDAVSTGDWAQSDGKHGWYSILWRRDPKAGFQWALINRDARDGTSEPSDEISGRVAQCKARERGRDGDGPLPGKGAAPVVLPDVRQPAPMNGEGKSQDGSLRWRWAVAPDMSRTLDVWMATETGEAQVVSDRVPSPAA
ncbi:MAG TPA: hypothetical protein VF475_05015 [Sphingobium sp.]